ncbi:hypothetical protein SAMN02745119_00468 [Trichlorobacter thiogenes]|uniref:Uncharacterized protein n=2 Tax=Trichlorobacter thiogenes TaxID=115783 RepID=A0A1T4KBU7_9BACT|nr:hypothetical protein SAMN02745119_00468 [Trichlorobacter thiogenes]
MSLNHRVVRCPLAHPQPVKRIMYYKVIEKFGPEDGERWSDYLKWRGLHLTRFESVDGVMRGDLFEPKSNEDWQNCVQEDFKISLITNFEYAKKVQKQYENAEIVGIDFPEEICYEASPELLGFDLLDSHLDISMLTNWGTDEEGIFSHLIMENGLLCDLAEAFRIRDILRTQFPEDHHAQECQVCAIYRISS